MSRPRSVFPQCPHNPMQVLTKPLNQELRKKLQSWLDDGGLTTARNIIRCKIALEKEKIVAHAIKGVEDEQFNKDAIEAARVGVNLAEALVTQDNVQYTAGRLLLRARKTTSAGGASGRPGKATTSSCQWSASS